ncbi:hypothetical protein B0H14DRAFT_2639444 [Mycena olivaceomarginata]|nr:hypothetical protein B0H14DRAFT_2639444 [Mycena olivaceomarginata]
MARRTSATNSSRSPNNVVWLFSSTHKAPPAEYQCSPRPVPRDLNWDPARVLSHVVRQPTGMGGATSCASGFAGSQGLSNSRVRKSQWPARHCKEDAGGNQRKLSNKATAGQEMIHTMDKDLINSTAIRNTLHFTCDLKAKADHALQDTIVATQLVDGFRNPYANAAHLKDHAGFPLKCTRGLCGINPPLRCSRITPRKEGKAQQLTTALDEVHDAVVAADTARAQGVPALRTRGAAPLSSHLERHSYARAGPAERRGSWAAHHGENILPKDATNQFPSMVKGQRRKIRNSQIVELIEYYKSHLYCFSIGGPGNGRDLNVAKGAHCNVYSIMLAAPINCMAMAGTHQSY